jgi:imidazolonepropionase-like amidohydrolase
MSLRIRGATIIDGVAPQPIQGRDILVEGTRIKAIAARDELGITPGVETIDVHGKYIIPGLMDANVHLMPPRLELFLRYEDHIEDLIVEAAQVALKNGVTTVFDTLGPRQALMRVRDRIGSGNVVGSRIFCAGNIVGLDGPISRDFNVKALEVASATLVERMNAQWVENVGPALTWMTPAQVGDEIRDYIRKGVDFIKYASSEHRWGDPTTSLIFSPRVQNAIVAEAHRAGLTAQAHATSVESLLAAIEAGCDLVQHCNITGPFRLPEATIDLMVERGTGAVVFPFTQRRFDWIMANCEIDRAYLATSDMNCRNLMESGAMLLMGTDGSVIESQGVIDPRLSKYWLAPGEDNLAELGQGHFHWLQAMEEKGLSSMEILRAATRNIAIAYGKDDLGTLEPGKIADLIVLDKDPLVSARHYRSIHMLIKDGAVVDRSLLPQTPLLTAPPRPPSEETLAYRAHRHIGRSGFPLCPLCADDRA